MQTVLPDYHFLRLAPGLGAEWLFDAGRLYWDRFRPTVLNDFRLLAFIPPGATVVVTAIARRDSAAVLGVELAQARPDAVLDVVLEDTFDAMRRALNDRAARNQPFGVPLPTPTPDPNQPIIPTPMLPATRPPAGFVTETPTPAPTATPAPPSATPEGFTSPPPTTAPIVPTPGALIGG